MNSPAKRRAPVVALVLMMTAAVIAAIAIAQDNKLESQTASRVLFEGMVRVGAADTGKAVQTDLRTWSLAPGLKAEKLALPENATLVIELHAGKLETLIGDKREERRPGTIWTLQPGEKITFTTGDDSVTLTTLALRSR